MGHDKRATLLTPAVQHTRSQMSVNPRRRNYKVPDAVQTTKSTQFIDDVDAQKRTFKKGDTCHNT